MSSLSNVINLWEETWTTFPARRAFVYNQSEISISCCLKHYQESGSEARARQDISRSPEKWTANTNRFINSRVCLLFVCEIPAQFTSLLVYWRCEEMEARGRSVVLGSLVRMITRSSEKIITISLIQTLAKSNFNRLEKTLFHEFVMTSDDKTNDIKLTSCCSVLLQIRLATADNKAAKDNVDEEISCKQFLAMRLKGFLY